MTPGEERTPSVTEPAERPDDRQPVAGQERDVREAEADLKTIEGLDLDAEAEFEQTTTGVRVVVEVEDAKPGKLSVVLHEKGDCSDIEARSMGDRFMLSGSEAERKTMEPQQRGKLGEIQINADGDGRFETTTTSASLKRDARMSLLNKALVLYEAEDVDLGRAGRIIACGVIEAD
jgi:Cu-Zn family superoxide dismutase